MRLFYGPPTETNFAGGLLSGTQPACQAACEAFAREVRRVAAARGYYSCFLLLFLGKKSNQYPQGT